MIPRAIIIFGDIGAGKTSIAVALSKSLGYKLIHFDRFMWSVAGKKQIYGPDDIFLLNQQEIQQIYDTMREKAEESLRNNKNVILESLYYKQQREQAISMLEQSGITYEIIEVKCALENILKRVKIRKKENEQTSGEDLSKQYYGTIEPEERKHITIDTTDKNVSECVEIILNEL